MSRVTRLILICAACLIPSALSAAAPKATDIVKRSHEAGLRMNLAGRLETTVYGAKGAVSASVRIYQSGARTRMEYLSGPTSGRTVINNGDSIIVLDQARKTATLSCAPGPGASLSQVFGNYKPSLAGSARIAGRDCYHVKLTPQRKGDPSVQLWVDKKTMFALRTDRCGSDGKPESRTVYTSVDYAARPAASLFAVPKGWATVGCVGASGTTDLTTVTRSVGFTPRKPGYIPKGYTFAGYCVRNTPRCASFAGLRYTNGLNTISVFESRGGCPGPGQGRGRGWGRGRGAGGGMCAGSGAGCVLLADDPQARVVRAWVGDLTVIVVGNIAQDELERIANSVK